MVTIGFRHRPYSTLALPSKCVIRRFIVPDIALLALDPRTKFEVRNLQPF